MEKFETQPIASGGSYRFQMSKKDQNLLWKLIRKQ